MAGSIRAGGVTEQLAADFTLKSQHDKNIKLSEQRGKLVILSFWSSWCGSCIQQLPILNRLYKKYKQKGLLVLAINIEQNNQKAKHLAKKIAVDFPILFDNYNQLSPLYNVESIPWLILIDRDGKRRDTLKSTSLENNKKFQYIIEGLLNE